MSEVICGPRGVSAGFNLNKWPRQRSQLKFRERGEQWGRRRIKLKGSGVCFALSFSLISLKGWKDPKWEGGTARKEPGLGLGSSDRKSWELEELWDLGQHGSKPWGCGEEFLSPFALSRVSWRGRIGGKNQKSHRQQLLLWVTAQPQVHL